MSYNLQRKIRRSQMKEMIREFKKEENLSNKKFHNKLFKGKQVNATLFAKFATMIQLATKALEEESKKDQ